MYVNTKTLEEYSDHSAIRSAFPNTSLPSVLSRAVLASLGVVEVERIEPTYRKLTQTATPLPAKRKAKDKYVQEWSIKDLSPTEIENNLLEAKASQWLLIKEMRDLRTEAGVNVGGSWFHSDAKSRIKFLGLARKADRIKAAGGDMTTPFPGPETEEHGFLYWKLMDGTKKPMTPALSIQVSDAMEALDILLFSVAENKRAELEASKFPEDYDVYSGWPLTFKDQETKSELSSSPPPPPP